MINLNIDKNNTIVQTKDKKHSNFDITLAIQKMIVQNDFVILKYEKLSPLIKLIIKDSKNKTISLNILYKNITHSGWRDKPHIKRIQVTNLKYTHSYLFEKDSPSSFLIYLGYYNFDSNPIFVVWDPERYTKHATNRSCYVLIETLQRGYDLSYLSTINSNQKLWVFKSSHFKQFVTDYADYINQLAR